MFSETHSKFSNCQTAPHMSSICKFTQILHACVFFFFFGGGGGFKLLHPNKTEVSTNLLKTGKKKKKKKNNQINCETFLPINSHVLREFHYND